MRLSRDNKSFAPKQDCFLRLIIREIKVLPSSRKITKIICNIVIQYKNPKFDVGGILSLELRFSV